MTQTGESDMSAVAGAIDAYGGDVGRWPDRSLASRAREAALADRDMRARLDAARSLDRGLDGLRALLDDEIAASGATGRVLAATRAGIAPRRLGRLRWVAAVAVLLGAAGLGSIADFGLAGDEAPLQVVVVDPLVFGPMAGDDR